MPKSWVPPMPVPKPPRAAACRSGVRKGELETVERNRDKSLGVTVYVGQRRGNASTSDFSRAAIEQTVQAAYDIARFTAEDPVAGLPDEADIAPPRRTATWTCSTPGP
jgi:predicted Zn-dependent protease